MRLPVDIIRVLNEESFINICGDSTSGRGIVTLNISKYLLGLKKNVMFINCSNLHLDLIHNVEGTFFYECLNIIEFLLSEDTQTLLTENSIQYIFIDDLPNDREVIQQLKMLQINRSHTIITSVQTRRAWDSSDIIQNISGQFYDLIFHVKNASDIEVLKNRRYIMPKNYKLIINYPDIEILESVGWNFKKDAEPQGSSNGFWYDLTSGGYIKPSMFLDDISQIKKIEDAIKLLISFEEALKDNELINEF